MLISINHTLLIKHLIKVSVIHCEILSLYLFVLCLYISWTPHWNSSGFTPWTETTFFCWPFVTLVTLNRHFPLKWYPPSFTVNNLRTLTGDRLCLSLKMFCLQVHNLDSKNKDFDPYKRASWMILFLLHYPLLCAVIFLFLCVCFMFLYLIIVFTFYCL